MSSYPCSRLHHAHPYSTHVTNFMLKVYAVQFFYLALLCCVHSLLYMPFRWTNLPFSSDIETRNLLEATWTKFKTAAKPEVISYSKHYHHLITSALLWTVYPLTPPPPPPCRKWSMSLNCTISLRATLPITPHHHPLPLYTPLLHSSYTIPLHPAGMSKTLPNTPTTLNTLNRSHRH